MLRTNYSKANYGSTRVGNQVFATVLSNQDNQPRPNGGLSFGRNFRVVHTNDLIPFAPFMRSALTSATYAHTRPFFNIGTNYNAALINPALPLAPNNLSPVPNVALADVTLIDRPDVDITNAGVATLLARGGTQLYGDHTFYLNKISDCREPRDTPPGVASDGDMTPEQFAKGLEDTFNQQLNGKQTSA
jgi:hypothetical protein